MNTSSLATPAVTPAKLPRSRRREFLYLVLALIALTVALRLPAFFVEVFNSDETFLATQAEVIQAGGDLYREATDRKPPLVPYLYAATFNVFDTNDLWTVRVVAMGAAALTAVLLALEARRRYGERAAWVAGFLCAFSLIACAPQDGQAANFEIFMLPTMTAGVLLARRGRTASAGVAIALATLAKQTGAATLLPVLYLVARARGRRGIAETLGGFGIPLVLMALALGPGQVLYWTVIGNGSYVGVETISSYVALSFLLMTLAWIGANLPMVIHLPKSWTLRKSINADGKNNIDLWIWVLSAVLSILIGLRFFGHYYLQLVPPVVLLATGALMSASKRVVTVTVVASGILALIISSAGYFLLPFGSEPKYQAVSRYLAAHSGPSDRMVVWGSVPEIYWASGVKPATRFLTTNTFLAGNHPGRPGSDAAPEDSDPEVWNLFFNDITKQPPRFIVDTATASIRSAEWTPLSRFSQLSALIKNKYRVANVIDDFTVYQRRKS
jgi:4-amino-4-deoxy-L-arabinose transferase-like glycosyltransferase